MLQLSVCHRGKESQARSVVLGSTRPLPRLCLTGVSAGLLKPPQGQVGRLGGASPSLRHLDTLAFPASSPPAFLPNTLCLLLPKYLRCWLSVSKSLFPPGLCALGKQWPSSVISLCPMPSTVSCCQGQYVLVEWMKGWMNERMKKAAELPARRGTRNPGILQPGNLRTFNLILPRDFFVATLLWNLEIFLCYTLLSYFGESIIKKTHILILMDYVMLQNTKSAVSGAPVR